ncbi:hypothetical protein CF8_2755 [Nocardioides sp. CF8]|nr:hypothetical protein CF8_2755 [Nocardioides sp. CF8]
MLLAVIAAQVAVPAVALGLAPAPFGFQMYAGTGWTQVEVTRHDGSTMQIHPTGLVANYRAEIDWTRRLPERICESDSAIAAVTVRRWREDRTLTCP